MSRAIGISSTADEAARTSKLLSPSTNLRHAHHKDPTLTAHRLRTAPGVAGAGLGALANSHFRRQIGHVFLLCSHVLMHMMWK